MNLKHFWTALALSVALSGYSQAQTGNGAPNGAHYNVNLIGVPKAELTNFLKGNSETSNGASIFMPLVTSKYPRNFDVATATCTTPDGKQTYFADETGQTGDKFSTEAPDGKVRIYFDPNTDGIFDITDRDAVDGQARIPIPIDENDGNKVLVDLYVRVLGKPGGCAEISGYALEEDIGGTTTDLWWYAGSILVSRTGGKSSFVEATDIFEVDYCSVDPTTLECLDDPVSISVFSDLFSEYFWEVNNFKAHLIQMRFYKRSPAG